MKFYYLLALFCASLTIQAFPMQGYFFKSNQKLMSSFSLTSTLLGHLPAKNTILSTLFLKVTSFYQPGMFQRFNAYNSLKSEETKKTLFTALHEKIEHNNSSFLKELTLEEVLQKIEDLGLINQSDNNDLTPLAHAIQASSKKSEHQQKQLIKLLLEYGAKPHDEIAFATAFKHLNFGALEEMQPHFEPIELYSTYTKMKMMLESSTLSSQGRSSLKKMVTIFSRPTLKPTFLYQLSSDNNITQEPYIFSCPELEKYLSQTHQKYSAIKQPAGLAAQVLYST